MTTLMGFVIGMLAMGIVVGFMAAIGTVVFNHPDDLIHLYAGIAAGVVIVLAAVAYLA